MEATSLCSSLKLSNLKQHHHHHKKRSLPSTIKISCSSRRSHHAHHDHHNDNYKDHEHHHDHDLQGRLVDEDMIVLRMRIHDMNMMETKNEMPSNWMEWEKKYYDSSYQSDVCEAVGWLQSQLMNTRPSLALGILVLVMLSVSTSMAMVLLRSIEIAKWVLSAGIYLN